MTRSHRINIVATPLWGVRIIGVAPSGRRTAPWLQRVRIHKVASNKFISALTAIAVIGRGEQGLLVPTPDGVREPQNRRVEIVLQ